MPTLNAMTTALRATLEGSQLDRDAVSKFIHANQETQKRILEELTKSQPSQALASVEVALVPLTPGIHPAASFGSITASAHWWGYEVFIPENVMQDLAHTPDLFATVTGLLAGVLTGPLAVVLGIVTGYIVAEFELMKKVDRGNGVKLTATWVAPVVLIPSAL